MISIITAIYNQLDMNKLFWGTRFDNSFWFYCMIKRLFFRIILHSHNLGFWVVQMITSTIRNVQVHKRNETLEMLSTLNSNLKTGHYHIFPHLLEPHQSKSFKYHWILYLSQGMLRNQMILLLWVISLFDVFKRWMNKYYHAVYD